MKRKMMCVIVAAVTFFIGAVGSASWCWYGYNLIRKPVG